MRWQIGNEKLRKNDKNDLFIDIKILFAIFSQIIYIRNFIFLLHFSSIYHINPYNKSIQIKGHMIKHRIILLLSIIALSQVNCLFPTPKS